MHLAVRDATSSDAERVARPLTELGYSASEEFAAERLAYFKSEPHSRVLVVEAHGELVGLVATHLVPRLDTERRSRRIVDLVVAEDHRRAGVGRTLLTAAEAEAQRHGCRRLDVSSGDWRPDAHAFYERLGFEPRSRGFVKRLPRL
jgi:GNAT superfamily N-acetyltransferase